MGFMCIGVSIVESEFFERVWRRIRKAFKCIVVSSVALPVEYSELIGRMCDRVHVDQYCVQPERFLAWSSNRQIFSPCGLFIHTSNYPTFVPILCSASFCRSTFFPCGIEFLVKARFLACVISRSWMTNCNITSPFCLNFAISVSDFVDGNLTGVKGKISLQIFTGIFRVFLGVR